MVGITDLLSPYRWSPSISKTFINIIVVLSIFVDYDIH